MVILLRYGNEMQRHAVMAYRVGGRDMLPRLGRPLTNSPYDVYFPPLWRYSYIQAQPFNILQASWAF